MDVTTVSECIPKGQCSKAQDAVDQVIDWSKKNLFQLNGDKTKELTITSGRNSSQFPRPLIDGLPFSPLTRQSFSGLCLRKLNLERSSRRSC